MLLCTQFYGRSMADSAPIRRARLLFTTGRQAILSSMDVVLAKVCGRQLPSSALANMGSSRTKDTIRAFLFCAPLPRSLPRATWPRRGHSIPRKGLRTIQAAHPPWTLSGASTRASRRRISLRSCSKISKHSRPALQARRSYFVLTTCLHFPLTTPA